MLVKNFFCQKKCFVRKKILVWKKFGLKKFSQKKMFGLIKFLVWMVDGGGDDYVDYVDGG